MPHVNIGPYRIQPVLDGKVLIVDTATSEILFRGQTPNFDASLTPEQRERLLGLLARAITPMDRLPFEVSMHDVPIKYHVPEDANYRCKHCNSALMNPKAVAAHFRNQYKAQDPVCGQFYRLNAPLEHYRPQFEQGTFKTIKLGGGPKAAKTAHRLEVSDAALEPEFVQDSVAPTTGEPAVPEAEPAPELHAPRLLSVRALQQRVQQHPHQFSQDEERNLRSASVFLNRHGILLFAQRALIPGLGDVPVEDPHKVILPAPFTGSMSSKSFDKRAVFKHAMRYFLYNAFILRRVSYGNFAANYRRMVGEVTGFPGALSVVFPSTVERYMTDLAPLICWLCDLHPRGGPALYSTRWYKAPEPEVIEALQKLGALVNGTITRIDGGFLFTAPSGPNFDTALSAFWPLLKAVTQWLMTSRYDQFGPGAAEKRPFYDAFGHLGIAYLVHAHTTFSGVREAGFWRPICNSITWTLDAFNLLAVMDTQEISPRELVIANPKAAAAAVRCWFEEHSSRDCVGSFMSWLHLVRPDITLAQQNTVGTTRVSSRSSEPDCINIHQPGGRVTKLNFRTLKTQIRELRRVAIEELWPQLCPVAFGSARAKVNLKNFAYDAQPRVEPEPGRCVFTQTEALATDANHQLPWMEATVATYFDVSEVTACHQNLGHFFKNEQGHRDFRMSYAGVQRYLALATRFKQIVFLLLLWSSGPTLRAIEWAELQLFDTPTSISSLRVLDNPINGEPVLTLHTNYSKNKWRGQAVETNVRFLGPEVTELLLAYLRFVHPLLHHVRLATRDGMETPKYWEYFFVSNDKIWVPADFTRATRKHTGLTMAQCRQASVYLFQEQFNFRDADSVDQLREDALGDDGERAEMVAGMFNHSTGVERNSYALDPNFGMGIVNSAIARRFLLCQDHNEWCFHRRGLDRFDMSAALEPAIYYDNTVTFATGETATARKTARAGLHNCLGPHAEWRSSSQCNLATHICARARRDVLYIAGTGAGKSLTFFAPASSMQHGDLAIIVICPLRAIQISHSAKATSYGIAHSTTVKGNHNLYILTWEQLGGSATRDLTRGRLAELFGLVERLRVRGLQTTVVIDELQMFMAESDYRSMHFISSIKKLPVTSIVALSATVTTPLYKWALSNVLRQPEIYRDPTGRDNIHYCVLPSSQKLQDLLVDSSLGVDRLGRLRRGIVFWKRSKQAMLSFIQEHSPLDGDGNPEWTWFCAEKDDEGNQLEDGESMTNLARFMDRSTKVKWIFATPSLSAGFDMDCIGCTIHYGRVRSFSAYLQESGRAGRWDYGRLIDVDEEDLPKVCATSYVIEDAPEPYTSDDTHFGKYYQHERAVFLEFLQASRSETKACVRKVLESGLHEQPGRTCGAEALAQCSSCSDPVLQAASDETARADALWLKAQLFQAATLVCPACPSSELVDRQHTLAACPSAKQRFRQMLQTANYHYKLNLTSTESVCDYCRLPMDCSRDHLTGKCKLAVIDGFDIVLYALLQRDEAMPLADLWRLKSQRGLTMPAFYFTILGRRDKIKIPV